MHMHPDDKILLAGLAGAIIGSELGGPPGAVLGFLIGVAAAKAEQRR
jgi:hypothetical protein